MNCGYCHNRCLIGVSSQNEIFEQDSVIDFLKQAAAFWTASLFQVVSNSAKICEFLETVKAWL